MTLIHRSKVDTWLALVLVLGFLGTAAGMVVGVTEGRIPAVVAAIILLVDAPLMLWLPFSIRYGIGAGELRLSCGPFRWRIPVDAIREVRPTRNPLSAPAASLDRLRIDYTVRGKDRMALVSPRNKEAFLEDLALASPGLRLDGDRLTRA